MDFWQQTSWFAVLCKPYQETLAASGVAKLGIEAFLPKVRCEQWVGGIPRMVSKPLFRGYFFVRCCPALSLDIVRYARGVLRVVGSNDGPTPLEDEIILALRQRIGPDGFVRLETTGFNPGDLVTIGKGPLAGWMGEVVRECNDGRRVMILLEAIQKACLLVEKRCLSTTVAMA